MRKGPRIEFNFLSKFFSLSTSVSDNSKDCLRGWKRKKNLPRCLFSCFHSFFLLLSLLFDDGDTFQFILISRESWLKWFQYQHRKLHSEITFFLSIFSKRYSKKGEIFLSPKAKRIFFFFFVVVSNNENRLFLFPELIKVPRRTWRANRENEQKNWETTITKN